MRRVRYQFGSLQLIKGVQQDVWTFRFYKLGPDGKRSYKRIRVGTKAQYPTETAALSAAEALRFSVNTGKPSAGARMKVAQELMRHANISTAMDVYAGVMERDKREVAGLVARAFLGTVQ